VIAPSSKAIPSGIDDLSRAKLSIPLTTVAMVVATNRPESPAQCMALQLTGPSSVGPNGPPVLGPAAERHALGRSRSVVALWQSAAQRLSMIERLRLERHSRRARRGARLLLRGSGSGPQEDGCGARGRFSPNDGVKPRAREGARRRDGVRDRRLQRAVRPSLSPCSAAEAGDSAASVGKWIAAPATSVEIVA